MQGPLLVRRASPLEPPSNVVLLWKAPAAPETPLPPLTPIGYTPTPRTPTPRTPTPRTSTPSSRKIFFDDRTALPTSAFATGEFEYLIEMREYGKNLWEEVSRVDSQSTSCSVRELQEGLTYQFRVSVVALNERSGPLLCKCYRKYFIEKFIEKSR